MGLKVYQRHSAAIIRTARWKALRLEVLRRDDWCCVLCEAKGRLEVDHVIPVRLAPDRAYDLTNLQTLCAACHTRKTRLEVGLPPLPKARRDWRDLIAADMRQKG